MTTLLSRSDRVGTMKDYQVYTALLLEGWLHLRRKGGILLPCLLIDAVFGDRLTVTL
jgi:hypothetical protein